MIEISPLDLQEKTKTMNNFIFDESQVLKNKVFTQLKLGDTFSYGLLLPKEIPIFSKNKEIVGKEQVWSPVLISSKREFLEYSKALELEHKIKFSAIPEQLPLRWSLELIEGYLKGDESIPELSPEEIAEKIKTKYEKFCFFREKSWYKVNCLWDMGTYLFMLFDNYPIKEERGLQGTGKTKTMRVSKNISFNATEILVNPSESTLFRETHDKRPTKYIDEAEKLFTFKKGQVEADSRVELINGSYSQGVSIPRMEKIGNNFVCIYYNVYSPTRIGSINGLFGATESRSITQVHTRSPDTDKRGETEPQDQDPEFQILRDYLYLFGLRYWKQIEESYRDNSLYENLKLKKRDLQIWKPLLAIAKVVSDDWFNEIAEFSEKLSLQRREDFIAEDSWDYRILEIVKNFIDDGIIKIRPTEIKDRYKEKYSTETERPPHEKTIVNHLDKIGFKELRQPRDNKGNYYLITKENFNIIVSPICPTLSTLPTLSTQSLINIEKVGVGDDKESVDNVAKDYDEGVGNVASVESVDVSEERVLE